MESASEDVAAIGGADSQQQNARHSSGSGTSDVGNEPSHSVVEVGSVGGGTLVVRRARVRAQRPSTYFAAPAAINVTAVRSRANSVAPSAVTSPRVRPTGPSDPATSLSDANIPNAGTHDPTISPGRSATTINGSREGADAQQPPEGRQVPISRPAASEQMKSQFALATASMERRLASRTQSRQASRMISRRLSPRGHSPARRASDDPIQRKLLQASAALERTKQSEVEPAGLTRSGSTDVAKAAVGAVEDGASRGGSLKRISHEAFYSPEAAAVRAGPSLGSHGGMSGAVTTDTWEGGNAKLAPSQRRSSLLTVVRAGEMPRSADDAAGKSMLPVASGRRESEGKNKVDEKHAEMVQQGVAGMLKVEEDLRASRIASRIASRSISRNPAQRPLSSLMQRTDVAHAAAEELRRRLAEEASDSAIDLPNKSFARAAANRYTPDAAAVSGDTRSEIEISARRELTELDQKATLLQAAWRGYRTRLWFVSVKLTATFERHLRQTFGTSKAFGWRSESPSEADDRLTPLMC
uniref:IQ calmodulin-binding motif domain-containing protein n=1 Tax=Toxoplasma gondii (strain ATCC 50861 / VEG) TaxID=432359 RepID=A0A0F7USJ5_TOXGV|nr:TPA: hypothetical protein BN1205_032630 [Toxoplasma gondii VEG]